MLQCGCLMYHRQAAMYSRTHASDRSQIFSNFNPAASESSRNSGSMRSLALCMNIDTSCWYIRMLPTPKFGSIGSGACITRPSPNLEASSAACSRFRDEDTAVDAHRFPDVLGDYQRFFIRPVMNNVTKIVDILAWYRRLRKEV